jgi:hypothetical protein
MYITFGFGHGMRRSIHNVPFMRKCQSENLKGKNLSGRPTYIWEELGVKYRRYESLNSTPVAQDKVQCQKLSSTETTERLCFSDRKSVQGRMGQIYNCSFRNTSYRKAMSPRAETFHNSVTEYKSPSDKYCYNIPNYSDFPYEEYFM